MVEDLEKKGVQVIQTRRELEELMEGTVVIRSHGVEKEIYDRILQKNLSLIDATCPYVKKIHKIVERESQKGSKIVIIGNPEHPEVQGIKGWSKTPVTVIESEEEAEKFQHLGENQICIVSQTTFNYNKFNKLVEIISKKRYDIIVLNTICSATEERQTEAGKIAAQADCMIVDVYKRQLLYVSCTDYSAANHESADNRKREKNQDGTASSCFQTGKNSVPDYHHSCSMSDSAYNSSSCRYADAW